LNTGPPALDASTLPLGYRGGGDLAVKLTYNSVSIHTNNKRLHETIGIKHFLLNYRLIHIMSKDNEENRERIKSVLINCSWRQCSEFISFLSKYFLKTFLEHSKPIQMQFNYKSRHMC